MRRYLWLVMCLVVSGAVAELSTVVVPGYTFSAGERLTLEKLNLAARPSVYVTGTVDGSNALSAGSVFPVHLAPSVAGSNLTYTASGLVIANAGVGVNQFSSAALGLGLTGGSGSTIRTAVDTNTITWAGNLLSVGAGLSNANLSATAAVEVSKLASVPDTLVGAASGGNIHIGLGNYFSIVGTNLVPTIWSTNFDTISAVVATNVPHGLGRVPQVRAVALCLDTDAGYAAGDEVDVANLQNSSQVNMVSWGGNATNVFISTRAVSGLEIVPKGGGAKTGIDETKWRFKVYAY